MVQAKGLSSLPDAPDHPVARGDRMQSQIALQGYRRSSCLLQDIWRNIHQRWAALGDKGWSKLTARTIRHVKRAAVCVQNARCPFDDEPVQFLRPNGFAEGFAKPVQEIKNQGFFDLNFLMGAFQPPNSPSLPVGGKNPPGDRRHQQSEEESRPHDGRASLLRRRLVMKVL